MNGRVRKVRTAHVSFQTKMTAFWLGDLNMCKSFSAFALWAFEDKRHFVNDDVHLWTDLFS
jgi:hypothetical protein